MVKSQWLSFILNNMVDTQASEHSFVNDFPGGLEGKAPVLSAGDQGSIPGLGSSPGEGNGNPLQYTFLENPMNRGAW